MENYIRPYLKANYYIDDDKQWCEINYQNCSYDVISEEQLRYLDKQFEKYLSSCEVANLIANREAGYLTKEEFCLRLDDRYLEALMQFKKKYSFRFYKAGELRKRVWIEDDKRE